MKIRVCLKSTKHGYVFFAFSPSILSFRSFFYICANTLRRDREDRVEQSRFRYNYASFSSRITCFQKTNEYSNTFIIVKIKRLNYAKTLYVVGAIERVYTRVFRFVV